MPAPRRAFARIAATAALMAMAIGSGVITPAAAQDEPVVIDLAERNQSGVTGAATLTPDGDQVTVRIEVEGPVGNNPVNIMTGTCEEFDANPVYSLSSVDANGVSESTVDASIADLLAEPHVINIHASPTNLGTIFACAEIVAEKAPAEETPTPAAEETATEEAASEAEVEITLATANESGVSGTAVLTAATDDTTEVVIQVSGVIGTNLAAIFPGTCDDLDLDAAYELNDLDESGASTTTIDVSLADLLAGEYALLVSDPEIALGEGSGLACGEIVGSVGGTTSGPATGAGVTTITGVSASTVGLFASAGVLLIAGGLLLRRRDAR